MSRSVDRANRSSFHIRLGSALVEPQRRVQIALHHWFRFPSLETRKRVLPIHLAPPRLADGSLVETIEDPTNPSRTCFLLARRGQVKITHRIVTSAGILLPLSRQHALLRTVPLPNGLRAYESRETLKHGVRGFLNSRYPLIEEHQEKLSEFAWDTWSFESRSFSPILVLVAPPSVSLPLVEALSQICMRALRVSTATLEGMIKARSVLGGTLIFSGELTSPGTSKLLAESACAGTVALRSEGAKSLYGPTVVATTRVPEDDTLLRNSTIVILPWRARAIGDSDGRAAALAARDLRNQLLLYRVVSMCGFQPASLEVILDGPVATRPLPPALTSHRPAEWALLDGSLTASSANARPTSWGVPKTYKALISATLFYYHEFSGSPIVKINRLLSKTYTPSWSHAAKWSEYPDLRILTHLAKGALRGWGPEAVLTEGEVGHILTDVGLAGLGPKGYAFQLTFTDEVVRKLHQLARFCGVLEMDLDPQASLDYRLCPYCREAGLVNKESLKYFEEFDAPPIREAERRKAEEAARRWAKYKQSGGLMGTISHLVDGESGEGDTTIPSPEPRPLTCGES